MIVADRLAPDQIRAADALLDAVEAHDGVAPLDEAARLQLRSPAPRPGGSQLLLEEDGALIGIASILPDGTIQGAVRPDLRRHGHGQRLWETAQALVPPGRTPQVWAHGALDSGCAFLRDEGLVPVRTLLTMELRLDDAPAVTRRELGDDVELTAFDPGRDLDELVRVNAAAFADHPEQGAMTREDVEERMAEPWFDAERLHLARIDDRLAAFVWVKREPGADDAEIYVVGTAPEAQGRGLATALLARALDGLRAEGVRTVELYVEAESAGAVGLYERMGFAVSGRDVMFVPEDDADGADDSHARRDRGRSARRAAPERTSTRAEDTGLVRPSSGDADEDGADGAAPEPRASPAEPESPLPEDRFLEREESWLAFDERVQELSADPSVPLLERLRFSAIFASNLDEFFMVRVAGLKRRLETGMASAGPSGVPPREVLERIRRRAYALQVRQGRIVEDLLLPELGEAADIGIVRWDELDEADRASLSEFFSTDVCGVLTPLAVDHAHPFPYVAGQSLAFIVRLRRTPGPDEGETKDRYALVKVPDAIPRYVAIGPDGRVVEDPDPSDVPLRFIAIEELIAANLTGLFPGMEVIDRTLFRVTRSQRLEVEEDDDENILDLLERELLRRRFGAPVRLEVAEGIDPAVRDWLMREIGVRSADTFELPGPLDLRGLHRIAAVRIPELSYTPFVPTSHPRLQAAEPGERPDVLGAIREGDLLLHHPYDSFATSVQAFLEQAAADPDVLAIKATLYRTSGDSPMVRALIAAAESGKQVLALVEVKAQFDERNNISWARKLEEAGAHVVHGVIGLKTHAKLALVVRDEEKGLRRYSHVGTGNYNARTARTFEDLSLLTCDDSVGMDLNRLFNQLSGYAPATSYDRLLVAPRMLRDGLLDLIDAEIAHHRAGRPARIRMKVNALLDAQVIDALYRASQAGVPIDLVVRGICALRPGVKGLSETITVRSVMGRFLEHSRIYAFAAGGEERVMTGSPDLMPRNLDRRVEALVTITDPDHRSQLLGLLDLLTDERISTWHLRGDGRWKRRTVGADGARLGDAQEELISIHRRRRPRA